MSNSEALVFDAIRTPRGRGKVNGSLHTVKPVDLVVGLAVGALFLGDQRLPVGDRDLVIVGMDFAEGEKAVAVPAVVDEGGLQRRLHARHLGQINVAAKLFTVGRFEVEFLDTVAAQNNHPGLLRVGRIDEHFVGH